MFAHPIPARLIALGGVANAACPTGEDAADGIVRGSDARDDVRLHLDDRALKRLPLNARVAGRAWPERPGRRGRTVHPRKRQPGNWFGNS